jgi:hypothetical protein
MRSTRLDGSYSPRRNEGQSAVHLNIKIETVVNQEKVANAIGVGDRYGTLSTG